MCIRDRVNPELLKKVLGDEKPVDVRPADLIPPQLPDARREVEEYMTGEEDLLSYVLFPNVALDFFKRRRGLLPPLPRREGLPKAERPSSKGAELSGKDLSSVDQNLVWRDSCLLYTSGIINFSPVMPMRASPG